MQEQPQKPEVKTRQERPGNFNELLDHLKAIKEMLGDDGVWSALSNFRLLAEGKGKTEAGQKWLKGKTQFDGWTPDDFQALVEAFEKD